MINILTLKHLVNTFFSPCRLILFKLLSMCRVCLHFQWKWFLLPCTFVCWLDLTLIIQSKRKLQTEMINSPDDDEGSERRQRRDKSERCLQLQARSPAENIQRSNANQKTVASHQYLSPSEMEKKEKKRRKLWDKSINIGSEETFWEDLKCLGVEWKTRATLCIYTFDWSSFKSLWN